MESSGSCLIVGQYERGLIFGAPKTHGVHDFMNVARSQKENRHQRIESLDCFGGLPKAWLHKYFELMGIIVKDWTNALWQTLGECSTRDSSNSHDHPVTQLSLAIIRVFFIKPLVPSSPFDPCLFVCDLPL